MSDRDRLSKFLYHLGKGLWKSVPILGPIVEEVFYAQLENELKGRVESLPEEEIQVLLDAVPSIDIQELDKSFDNLSEEMKCFGLHQTTAFLAEIERHHRTVTANLDDIEQKLDPLPSMLDILLELREKSGEKESLLFALDDFSRKREQWIKRISGNQSMLLKQIPDHYVKLAILWDLTRKLIPTCVYKEFRFRLHELEWLGLVKRYWDREQATWMYKRSNSGKEVARNAEQ
ncbi:hypothetical protein ACFL6U_16260 [Planctomycetota bacterium]